MTAETITTLTDSTIAKLQDLIRINIDSALGFREAAEKIEIQSLAELFRNLAADRTENSNALQRFVQINRQEAAETGTMASALSRIWNDIRTAVAGGDAYSILCQAERGEDHIKKAYEDAIVDTAGSPVNSALSLQLAGIAQDHDRIRELRDEFAEA